jgi:ribonuclease Y
MESIPVEILVAVAVLALGLGIVTDRILLRRLGHNRLARAKSDADRLRSDQLKEIAEEKKERIAKLELELNERRQQFDSQLTESGKQLGRAKRKLEKRQEILKSKERLLEHREVALVQAAEALEALKSEAEQSRQQGAGLYEQAVDLLERARSRRDEVDEYGALLEAQQSSLTEKHHRLTELIDEHVRKLENVAGLSEQDARGILFNHLRAEAKLEAASEVKEIKDEARLRAARQARKILLTTIQRTAASHTIENTVSIVNLDSDDMKGRIIGREGRNIRAFEALTGIEVIVDDTPEAVILSGFDPVRREVARLALSRLIQDGRIHPARIEETVEKVRSEMDEEIVEAGERAVIDLNLHGIHPELVRLVGRMRYRTSFGQNLLAHSIETARIASIMAAEIGLDASKARRAGLLHDIGKVSEDPIESPHALVGMDLCLRYKESPDVCNAVGAHHDEIEMKTLIAPVVQAADAVSGARPGARREALEAYIRRLEKLEKIAASFDGVERVYAIQAGREIRVIVNHNLISDAHADMLASDVAQRIQKELQYPGQIKVTVIREVRSVSYAR